MYINGHISAVCPGMVNTPMAVFVTKNYEREIVSRMVAQESNGRFGKAEEIAATVLWLCSPEASFVVGHAMAVDGGILAGLPLLAAAKASYPRADARRAPPAPAALRSRPPTRLRPSRYA